MIMVCGECEARRLDEALALAKENGERAERAEKARDEANRIIVDYGFGKGDALRAELERKDVALRALEAKLSQSYDSAFDADQLIGDAQEIIATLAPTEQREKACHIKFGPARDGERCALGTLGCIVSHATPGAPPSPGTEAAWVIERWNGKEAYSKNGCAKGWVGFNDPLVWKFSTREEAAAVIKERDLNQAGDVCEPREHVWLGTSPGTPGAPPSPGTKTRECGCHFCELAAELDSRHAPSGGGK